MTTKVTSKRKPLKASEREQLSSRKPLELEHIKTAYLGSKVDKSMSSDSHLDKKVQYVVPDSKSENIAQISSKLPVTAKRFGYTIIRNFIMLCIFHIIAIFSRKHTICGNMNHFTIIFITNHT